jgi:hypothetical protein
MIAAKREKRPTGVLHAGSLHFPDAAKIVLVQDNLNTHRPAPTFGVRGEALSDRSLPPAPFGPTVVASIGQKETP